MFWLWFRSLCKISDIAFCSPYLDGRVSFDTEYIRLCYFWGVNTKGYIENRAELNFQLEGLRGYEPFKYWKEEAAVKGDQKYIKDRVLTEVAWNESGVK